MNSRLFSNLELGIFDTIPAASKPSDAKKKFGSQFRRRVEFEFESRDFRDHGHPGNECDVIVCWRHNWPECPSHIEVVALERVIESLAKSED